MSNWKEEEVSVLEEAASEGVPVTLERVAQLAETLDRSAASVSAKLRNMGNEVERKGDRGPTFSDEQAQELQSFVESHSGEFTYGELAEQLFNGAYSARQIQGKILALELYSHVKPTPPRESVRTFSEEEEAQLLDLIRSGAYLEDIAEQMGRLPNQIRGKALSFMKEYDDISIPTQRDRKPRQEDAISALGDDITNMTVAEIAETTGKTERGIKSALTHRGIEVKDYNGAKRRAKRDAQAA